jgi:hypothetical protein
VADVADAGFPRDLRLEVGAVHRLREIVRDLAHRAVDPRADVVDVARRLRLLQRQHEGLRHVLHMDEVAPLPAVLEDHRAGAVEDAGGEDGEHARVGIG